jgi:2-amino-4-hydroxy-6-hydroxymethyldihydropteridine diphosphokinase
LTLAVLGLGGNIGDPERAMREALDRLRADPAIRVEAVSALYETPPWGKTDQPRFLNAAARIDTSLVPRDLLEAVLAVERDLGRDRTERWGPRTIDIDILLYGDIAVDEQGLTVPHPRLAERIFALAPLVDVAPEASIGGQSASLILETLDPTGLVRLKTDWWPRRDQSSGSPT